MDTRTLPHPSGPVEVHLSGSRVTWCSRWELIEDLVRLGHLRREWGGPGTYGHVDYLLA